MHPTLHARFPASTKTNQSVYSFKAPSRVRMSSVTGCCDVHGCVRDQPSNAILYTTASWLDHRRQI